MRIRVSGTEGKEQVQSGRGGESMMELFILTTIGRTLQRSCFLLSTRRIISDCVREKDRVSTNYVLIVSLCTDPVDLDQMLIYAKH